jgi:hypothetical protein
MRTFKLEQSNKEITTHAGMALVGAAINKHTSLAEMIDAALPKRHGTPTSDMVKTTIGLLAQAKSDFQAINNVRDDGFFHQALDLQKNIPTDTSIRTRYEKEANEIALIVNQASVDFLVNSNAPVSALSTGHIPLDIDVTPHDNSNTKKEGVSYTYKGKDGYAPIACYLGVEGWSVRYELRPGSQHSQCDFIPTLEHTLAAVHPIMEKKPLNSQILLIRLDSAHDSKETRAWLYEAETPLLLDFIIKWNPRKEASEENKEKWLNYAKQLGPLADWETPREGKQVVTFSVYVEEEFEGKRYTTRRVMQLTKRTIDKHGQELLIPELEIEGWWTTLELPDESIKALYRDHATSEQFHSEFKTDMDLERLPSGKFASNALILTMGAFVYNLLKWIGLVGLMGKDSPVRHKAKRRRIRTVMQELIYVGAHIYERGRRLYMRFGKTSPGFNSFRRVYQLCVGS